jgi:hypothetical protein
VVAAVAGVVAERVPPLTDRDREYLVRHFEPENEKLAVNLGLSLDPWTRAGAR